RPQPQDSAPRRGESDEQGPEPEKGTEEETGQDNEGEEGREAREERQQAVRADLSALRRPRCKARTRPGLFRSGLVRPRHPLGLPDRAPERIVEKRRLAPPAHARS